MGLAPTHARRRLLLGAASASALVLAGCATPAPGGGTSQALQVAAGVYMVQGASGEVGTDNLGRIGNAGFIVGPAGVVAVDTGTSYRHGVALLQAIASVTALPVRAVVLTHTRQEFLFGAAAFQERGIPVHMQARAAALMAARCENCLKTLKRVLGEDAMQRTVVVKPDHTFEASQPLAGAGRPVRLLYFGHSSGPGDVAVLDEDSGTLFAGGLLDHQRIPDVQDSRLPGWAQALVALKSLPLRAVVPGHGPAGGPALIGNVERYLVQLQAGAKRLLDSGAALSEVPQQLRLPEFERWDDYDIIHRRNASVVFLRLEQEQLLREGSTP